MYKGKECSTLYMPHVLLKTKVRRRAQLLLGTWPVFALCGSLLPAFTFIHASSCLTPTKTSER